MQSCCLGRTDSRIRSIPPPVVSVPIAFPIPTLARARRSIGPCRRTHRSGVRRCELRRDRSTYDVSAALTTHKRACQQRSRYISRRICWYALHCIACMHGTIQGRAKPRLIHFHRIRCSHRVIVPDKIKQSCRARQISCDTTCVHARMCGDYVRAGSQYRCWLRPLDHHAGAWPASIFMLAWALALLGLAATLLLIQCIGVRVLLSIPLYNTSI